jgi:hypothetical protein
VVPQGGHGVRGRVASVIGGRDADGELSAGERVIDRRVSGGGRADPLSPATRELESERDHEGCEPDRVLKSSRCE